MVSLIFSGYLSSIGKVFKNIRKLIAFFRGPNIDHMNKYEKKEILQFSLYCPYNEKSKVGRCVSAKYNGGGGG